MRIDMFIVNISVGRIANVSFCKDIEIRKTAKYWCYSAISLESSKHMLYCLFLKM